MNWFTEHDVEQGSPEWLDLRRGKITASRANKLFATTKAGKWTTARAHTVVKIAMELLHGKDARVVSGKPVERGHEYEAQAAGAYEFLKACETEICGFLTVTDHASEGYSPDRLVGDNGLLEIKVPTALEKHVSYLETEEHAVEYEGQLRHGLYVSGREWIDIASYYPEAPANLQLAIARRSRADLKLADYPDMLSDVWREIIAKRDALQKIQEDIREAA